MMCRIRSPLQSVRKKHKRKFLRSGDLWPLGVALEDADLVSQDQQLKILIMVGTTEYSEQVEQPRAKYYHNPNNHSVLTLHTRMTFHVLAQSDEDSSLRGVGEIARFSRGENGLRLLSAPYRLAVQTVHPLLRFDTTVF